VDQRTVKLQLDKVSKVFVTERRQEVPVFRDLDMTVYNNEFVSVIGPSGCGKTTLLSLVAGLIPVTSGPVLMDGKEICKPGRERGVIFQQDAILPWRTVLGNVEYGLELRGVAKAERRRIAEEYLSLVGLREYADFYPKELSGGMKPTWCAGRPRSWWVVPAIASSRSV
jgi:NitT/TauT family transport system ATP-binding protein